MMGGVGGLQGSLAEFVATDTRLLAKKPKNLGMREAAALPLIFITAWEGLVDRTDVRAGQKVLVHGGAGGVGHMAVQIARAFDADVFATGSHKDKAYIEHLGVVFIDRETPLDDYVAEYTAGRGFDIIYDTVGGAVLDASFNAVTRFGHVVSALGWGTHALAPLSFRAASYSGVFTLLPMLTGEGRAHHGDILREATKLIEVGKIVPRPSSFQLRDRRAGTCGRRRRKRRRQDRYRDWKVDLADRPPKGESQCVICVTFLSTPSNVGKVHSYPGMR
jgi:NADPH2:quinone reductase